MAQKQIRVQKQKARDRRPEATEQVFEHAAPKLTKEQREDILADLQAETEAIEEALRERYS